MGNDFKPKRYIIEMCNNYAKRNEATGNREIVERIEKTRNYYIKAMLTEDEVIKEIYNDINKAAELKERENEMERNESENKMKVIICEPGKEARIETISKDLEAMQNVVGGYIEAIYFTTEPVAILCNEEGKINGLELNRLLKDENGKIIDIIAGTFMVIGLTEDDFTSVPEDLIDKYMEQFRRPETYLHLDNKIVAIPNETK